MWKNMRAAVTVLAIGTGIVAAQDLRIVKAEYGHDRRWADVTDVLRRASNRGQLDIVVDNNIFGFDPAPAEVKTLRIEYFMNGQQMREEIPEHARLTLPKGGVRSGGGFRENGRLRILSAQYGAGDRVMDVTSMLQNQIRDGFLVARVDPGAMRGDPARGRQKTLMVEYEYMGRSYRTQAADFTELRLPERGVMAAGGGPFDNAPPIAQPQPVVPAGDLQIISAYYGSRNHYVDVSRAVAAYMNNGQLRMRINNDTMGVDPDRNADKFLRIEYSFNGRRDSVQVGENGDLVLPRPGIGDVGVIPSAPSFGNSGLIILSAGYGARDRFVDVTRILQGRQSQNGALRMNVTNDTMGGDPIPGPDKVLRVDYQIQGRTLHKDIREGDQLVLP